MRKILVAAALMIGLASGGADAQKLDKNGKCHDASGKFAKMEVCQPGGSDKGAACRDTKTGKFAKCDAPGAAPVTPKAAAPAK